MKNFEEAPSTVTKPAPKSGPSKTKLSTTARHEELKRKGLEKKFLLAQLTKKEQGPIELYKEEDCSSDEEAPVRARTPSKPAVEGFDVKDLTQSAPKLKKFKKSAKEGSSSDKPTSKYAMGLTKHTDHKRQKMREREREKRQRLKEKKQRKLEKRGHVVSQSAMSKEASRSALSSEVPLESIRELGSKLMAKFQSRPGKMEK